MGADGKSVGSQRSGQNMAAKAARRLKRKVNSRAI